MVFTDYETTNDRLELLDRHGAPFFQNRPYISYVWELHTHLKAFKKVHSPLGMCIANLIIPVGAKVVSSYYHYDYDKNSGKLRADRAVVHSIVLIETKKKLSYAYSAWSPSFKYSLSSPLTVWRALENEQVPLEECITPRFEFDFSNEECSSGIHFFVSLPRALDWKI